MFHPLRENEEDRFAAREVLSDALFDHIRSDGVAALFAQNLGGIM